MEIVKEMGHIGHGGVEGERREREVGMRREIRRERKKSCIYIELFIMYIYRKNNPNACLVARNWASKLNLACKVHFGCLIGS